MTIAVTVKVHDGIVLASDSASTLVQVDKDGNQGIINVHDNANKIFNLYKGLPIGGITHGAGSIGHASISTLAKDLRDRFQGDPDYRDWHIDPENYTIEKVAEATREFLYEEHYKSIFSKVSTPPRLSFKVAGFSAGQPLSELWDITIMNGDCPAAVLIREQDSCGIDAAGDPEAISRLVLGYGQELPKILVEMGIKESELETAMNKIRSRLQVDLAPAPMPIQDAIELSEFLVDIAIRFTKFKLGAPTVGGPIEIAGITKHEGFKWIKRKHYFDVSLNPETRDVGQKTKS